MSNTRSVYGGTPDRERLNVEVVARTSADGLVTPLEVWWRDGTHYRVDAVLDRRRARSLKTGGTGMRFTVSVRSSSTYLFLDDTTGTWFVEAKVRRDADWGC